MLTCLGSLNRLFDVDFYYQIHRHLMIELDKFLVPLKIPSEYGRF